MLSSKSACTLNRREKSGSSAEQQVVELAVAEQHHLDVERNRLGIERLRRDQVKPDASIGCSMRISRALMARFKASQANGDSSSLARIEQQIAAVGAMQRAGLDQQEVGDQRAHLGDVLDPADEVAVGGIELLDDRRPGGRPSPLETMTLTM